RARADRQRRGADPLLRGGHRAHAGGADEFLMSGLVAAIYGRKSNEQHIADEEKSVTRQVELALACATRHRFEVPPERVYVDDAISGAESDRRPGLMRLLNALRPRAPFTALFLADKDRLGREQFETNHILKQISLAGVRIFEYQNGGQEVRLDSPIDK